ncbi:EEV glycoprotein [Bovine papular stomatitis virus]
MAHGTFGDTDSEANATYVASVKRQKAIRRYVKLFFRLMAALAIIVLSALVIILALELSDCRNKKCDDTHDVYNKTCNGVTAGRHCLTINHPDTWENASEKCNNLGQRLPSTKDADNHPWLGLYLQGTWSDGKNSVFGASGNTDTVLQGLNAPVNKYFCVDGN